MTESGSQSTLYVSYAGQDVDFAFKLAADLKNAGFNIWIEQVDLNANENHLSVLEYALEHCPVILPILSVNNVATRTIWDDFVQLANEANSRIVPLTLDEANLPAFSQHYSVVDFCSWKNEIQYADSLGSLADIIEADRIRRDSETPDLETQFINRLVAEIKRYKVLMEIANSPSKGLPSDKRAIYSQSMWGLTGTFEVYTGSSAQAVGSVYEFGEILSKFPKLLLVGARGSGKTTTLYRALLNALRTYQADPSRAPLPLLLPLGAWLDDVRIETFIRDQWTLGGDPIEEIAAGNVIVFLDGLNEVGQPIQNKLDSLQIWLDSDFAPRYLAISSDLSVLTRNIPKLPVVRLKEADIPRIRQYAVNHLERDNAQKLLDQIIPDKDNFEEDIQLFRLARNAFFLAIMVSMIQENPDRALPTHEARLLDWFGRFMWSGNILTSSDTPFEEIIPGISRLAFQMIDHDMPSHVPYEYALSHIGEKSTLQAGLDADILQMRGNTIYFYNEWMRDYFAAQYLLYEEGMYSRLMRAEFTESGNRVAWKWDAVTFLCSALAADTDAIISQIAEVNPYLALECILSGLELSEATTWEVVQHLLAYPRTVDQVYLQKIARALNHMGNAETVSALLEYLHDDIFNQYDIQGVNEVMIMPLKTLGTDTIRFLMDILKGEKWQRRRGAAWALGELKEPAAVPGLVEALRDENENVRREAAYALLRIGRQALPRLLKSLDDADPDMRAAAIKVLGRMGDATAVPNLIACLKDTEWPQLDEARICDLAAIALEHIGTDEAFAAVDTWRQGGKANALSSPWNGKIRNEQPLTVRHNKSADQLVGELQNTEWVKRRDAVKKLGDSGNEDVLPHILSMLKDEDSQVRWTAVQALENFQGPDILQGLLVAIRDDDFLISDAAGKALSKLGELALPGLVEALTHKNVDVRGVATEALGRIGSEEAIPYLADALADTEVPAWEETRVCDIAAAALARINTEKSLFTLENWRKEQGSSYTVPELDIALPLLHLDDISRDGDDDPKRQALIEFLDALHEERWENQRQAAGALKQYAQTLKDTNDEMALQKLAFALEDKHPLVRWTATETLAWTGDTAATPALLQALQDEMWTVRVSAIRALAAVKADTQKTLPGLINALQDKNHVVREAAAETLGLIGDETAGEALTYALHDKDSFVRRAAVEALGRVKDMTVVPILISSLDDEDNNVQWAAVETLGELGDPSAIPILTQYLENTSSPNWEERRLCDIAALALEKIGTDQAKDAVNKWREAH